MNLARSCPKIILCALFVLTATQLWAGPPFQTDDPQTIDLNHFEFYQFASVPSTPVDTAPTGPAFEFNWGAFPNMHIHLIVTFGADIPSTGPSAYGLTDTETGAKIRFVQETKHRPQIGIYPMFELPTGNSRKGLGVGKVWYKMPLWIQKSRGEWTTYGGVGYQIVPQHQYRNFIYAGWLLQRNLGKKLTLGTEIFSHQKEGLATPQTKASTLLDIGGQYYIRNPGLQLLFAYGHSIAGGTESYAYLGLYQTWGNNSHKAPNSDKPGFLSRLFPSHTGE